MQSMFQWGSLSYEIDLLNVFMAEEILAAECKNKRHYYWYVNYALDDEKSFLNITIYNLFYDLHASAFFTPAPDFSYRCCNRKVVGK